MLKIASYNIVFQEVPGEVSLALNISNCPNRCKGCHSTYLQEDVGVELNSERLFCLLERYGGGITCVCFMGGDAEVSTVNELASFVHSYCEPKGANIKVCWYSAFEAFPPLCNIENFNYVKLGPYLQELGGLDKITTNQRFYAVNKDRSLTDITASFRK